MHVLVDQQRITLIPGSCVGRSLFVGCSQAHKARIFLLPASMLKDKGVVEFIEAALYLKAVAPHRTGVLCWQEQQDMTPFSHWLGAATGSKTDCRGAKKNGIGGKFSCGFIM